MSSEDKQGYVLQRLQERLTLLNIERDKILTAIEVIGEATGPNTDAPNVPPGTDEAKSGAATNGLFNLSAAIPKKVVIRPDSYFGLSQHQAARKYLLDLGHADKVENIIKALNMGGVEVGGANPLETMRATFTKNSSVFVRVGPNTFGLREFYPHLQGKTKGVVFRRPATVKRRPMKRVVRKAKGKSVSAPVQEAPIGNGA